MKRNNFFGVAKVSCGNYLNVNIEEKKRVGYGSTLKIFFYIRMRIKRKKEKEMEKCFWDTCSEFKFLFFFLLNDFHRRKINKTE